ncbi:group 1 truncated hemoglobin [Aliikangiella sp. G2MR2-5]|uniref:group I truncated hemoglobin n=1 Tax=Aliikangiella sp. G2MR2-5 TaxID=2788943 RepID=UPI0018ABFC0E|nr:group 1 truncated hemoglobin [Aliikangiella sp. G2MR2-5]
MDNSLFYRVGGDAAVEAAVNLFYENFINEPKIKGFFTDVDHDEQLVKLRKFFKSIMGGEEEFNRVELRDVHAPLVEKGLNDSHYDIFIKIMTQTLNELDIPVEIAEDFVELCESFRDDVLGH